MNQVAIEASGRVIAWIPGRLHNPSNGPQRNWRAHAAERKDWRGRTRLCVQDALNRAKIRTSGPWPTPSWSPADPKIVVLTVLVWSLFDEDGLANALKPVVDGLRDAGVLHRDDTSSGHRIERRQVINRAHRGVEVVIEPRAPGEAKG